MTKEELAVVKEEMEEGTSLEEYLESIKSEEKPEEIYQQLTDEYGSSTVAKMTTTAKIATIIKNMKKNLKWVIALPDMKGKKTKIKKDLKAMINKL